MLERTCSIVLVTAGLAVLAGCGDDETPTVAKTTPSPAATATPTPAATPDPTPEPTPDDQVGETVTSGGIKLRVLDFRASRTIKYQGGVQSSVTPDANPKTVKAPQGGRYFFVRTRLENDTKGAIDITCSYEIVATALDAEDREYQPVDELFQLRGNPRCNDKVQPGFKTTMTWAFLIPKGARVDRFTFQDVTEALESGTEEPVTEVRLR